MLRNRIVPEPGDVVVVCHVPEYDYDQRLFRPGVVMRVWPGTIGPPECRQVELLDGSRTAVASCWPSLAALREAVEMAEALATIDAQIMGCT